MSGPTLSHYELIEKIGAGGMGEVWRARDTRLARTEAAGEMPVSLAWSPDGAQIAFTTQGALWRVTADGEHVTLVTRGEISLDSHAQLAWTWDGQLVYSDGSSRDLLGRSFLVEQTTPLFSADEETTLHFDGVHVLPDDSLLVVRHRLLRAQQPALGPRRDEESARRGPPLDDGSIVLAGTLPDGRIVATEGAGKETVAIPRFAGEEREVLCQGVISCLSRDGTLGLVTTAETRDGSGKPPEPAAQGLGTGTDISPDNRWALSVATVGGAPQVFLASLGGSSPRLEVSAEGGGFAWFDETGASIYFWSDATSVPGKDTAELWRVSWQAEPEPQLGEPELLVELQGQIHVTDFDSVRQRFVGNRRLVSPGRRIVLKTGWGESAPAR